MGIMKLLSVKIIGLKVLMVFDYDKMKIIEIGKITNLYQYVNNNLRTIYFVNWYRRLPLAIINILSKRKTFEAVVKSVARVSLFDVYTDKKDVEMKFRIADNNV